MAVPVSGNTSPVARRLEGCLRHVVRDGERERGSPPPVQSVRMRVSVCAPCC